MIQSSGFLCNMFGNLGKKVMVDLRTSSFRDDLPGLVSNLVYKHNFKCNK